ncbi:MAG: flagellar basal body-associated FliL family protein, partial [Proteobacteria bacterium]|nr:flagellar basal body-associated FliL family protein [Pseudomonadota bacterium]
EARLTEELSKEGEARRYRGHKVELDKADLNLDLDLDTEEGPEVDDGPPALTATEPLPPEAPAWWTRWPVLAGAGAAAAVLGVALVFMLRGPAPEGPTIGPRTVWRGQIEDRPSLRLALDPFFVPIKGAPSRQLRVRLVIVLSDFRARAHFRRFSPSLIACRNAVYQILTHKSLEELTLNKVGLQRQIQTRLNQIISGGKVTQVHFTEFLVTRAGDPIINRG